MKKYVLLLSEPEIELIIKGLSEIPLIVPSQANPLQLKKYILNQCDEQGLNADDLSST